MSENLEKHFYSRRQYCERLQATVRHMRSLTAIEIVNFITTGHWASVKCEDQCHIIQAVDTFVHARRRAQISYHNGSRRLLLNAYENDPSILDASMVGGLSSTCRFYDKLLDYLNDLQRAKLRYSRTRPVWAAVNQSYLIVGEVNAMFKNVYEFKVSVRHSL